MNDGNNSSKLILKTFENIIDIEISFTYEQLCSVLLRTNLGRTHQFGKKAQNTSVCTLREETTENNVIFGFSGIITAGSIKEIQVIRGLVLDVERYEPRIVSAKQFFIEKHKAESKDPERYQNKVIETKKYMINYERQQKINREILESDEQNNNIQQQQQEQEVSDIMVFNEEEMEQLDFVPVQLQRQTLLEEKQLELVKLMKKRTQGKTKNITRQPRKSERAKSLEHLTFTPNVILWNPLKPKEA